MKVTENVIMDLLPVYLSGDACPDTKDLIEEFLRQNPEFAKSVQAQRREFGRQKELLEPGTAPSADHELHTLARTRSLMERQKWLMALALMLTGCPFAFVFSDGHLAFMIVRDQPMLAVAFWFGAAILWVQYFITRRRVRLTGL